MTSKQVEYYLLDVFTDKKYGGNQLAVFSDASTIDPTLFQSIARELNLSETVFLFPPKESKHFSMRIFTPGQELPTAGHPTIGTAFLLSEELAHPEDGDLEITLLQKVGPIKVVINYKNNLADMITMEQPLPYFGSTHEDKREMVAATLGLEVTELATDPIQEVSCGNNTLIVPLKSIETLAKIEFNSSLWKKLKPQVNNALIYAFTQHNVKGGDVQGRMFAPEIGITEDPATGSANGPLIAYLTKYDLISRPLVSLQGYEMGRPSQLFLDTDQDQSGAITSVKVGGKSVLVGKGIHFL